MLGKSWKTTSAGIIGIVGGIIRLLFAIRSGNFSEEAIMTSVTGIVGGLGFLFAKDSDVTGGTKQQ
jgi:hypothetical protein